MDIRDESAVRPPDVPLDPARLVFGRHFSPNMFLMEWHEGRGWHDPRVVPDYGVDVIARDKNNIIAIQTKKYSIGNNVCTRDVQRLLGAMQLSTIKANKAILITTSDFTFQAKEQAKETPVEL